LVCVQELNNVGVGKGKGLGIGNE